MTARRLVLISAIVGLLAPLLFLATYAKGRVDCYRFPNGTIDQPQVLNACVAPSDGDWKLPGRYSGFMLLPWLVSSAKCSTDYKPSLFFVEQHFACEYFHDNVEQFIGVGAGGSNPIHELVRRHGACLTEGEQCYQSQLQSIDLLLQHGLAVDVKEDGEMSALAVAALDSNIDMVRLLLERGALPQNAYSDGGLPRLLSELKEREDRCVRFDLGDECATEFREIRAFLEVDTKQPDSRSHQPSAGRGSGIAPGTTRSPDAGADEHNR